MAEHKVLLRHKVNGWDADSLPFFQTQTHPDVTTKIHEEFDAVKQRVRDKT